MQRVYYQRRLAGAVRWSARKGKMRTMRHTRIVVTHYGGPDSLRVVEEECPEPKDGEVRVRVLAAGVSQPDIIATTQRDGRSHDRLGLPAIQTSEEVTGDRVSLAFACPRPARECYIGHGSRLEAWNQWRVGDDVLKGNRCLRHYYGAP